MDAGYCTLLTEQPKPGSKTRRQMSQQRLVGVPFVYMKEMKEAIKSPTATKSSMMNAVMKARWKWVLRQPFFNQPAMRATQARTRNGLETMRVFMVLSCIHDHRTCALDVLHFPWQRSHSLVMKHLPSWRVDDEVLLRTAGLWPRHGCARQKLSPEN